MTKREAVVVGIVDRDAALRRLIEGSREPSPLDDLSEAARKQLRHFEPDRSVVIRAAGAASVREGIHSIEDGSAITVFLAGPAGAVVLKERNTALADGETCYARIFAGWDQTPGAEPFEAAADICEVLQTAALSVFYRFLPAGPRRSSRRPWLESGTRRCAIGDTEENGFTIADAGEPRALPVTTFSARSLKLVLLSADTPDELERQLTAMAAEAQNGDSLAAIARLTQMRCRETTAHRLGLALIARTPADLLREIELIRNGVARTAVSGEEWKTPAGSCFTVNPLGSGGVAFVYPGVASPYEGVGADLFAVAPPLMDRFDRLAAGQAGRYLHVDDIYPREPSDRASFFRDVVALGECAISVSSILTMLMRDVFGVQPHSALGYSFGEAIMLAALGVWPVQTMLTSRLDTSPTFRSRLQGPMQAVRESWGVAEGVPLRWRSYCVRATPAEAYAALRGESRAYLCMINSPDQAVIAGDEDACGRVIERLGSAVVPMPIAVTMHCPPALSEQNELVRIHDLETAAVSSPALYSSANYEPVPADRAALASAIAAGYTRTLDFPRLIHRVYSGGARVFLELGGRRNCSTWIEKILRSRPHTAIPCDAEGQSGDAAVLRAVARLFIHRVPLNLESLTE